MFFFAVFAFVAALVFGLVARSYPLADHYRQLDRALAATMAYPN